VIIPCYNYGRFLPDSISSALEQQGVEPEVIVVDDASTDDSAAVAQEYAARDPRVSVIRHRENAGHVVAFNDGLAAATGDYIVRLDADDLLAPGALERAVAVFEAYPSVGLVYGHPLHFRTPAPPQARTAPARWRVWSGADWIAERCRVGVNCITTPEAVVRASVMKEIGGLDTRLRFAQDMEMWLRVAAVSDVARIMGPDQALHRDHSASMSETSGAGRLLDLEERRMVFQVLFSGPGSALPRSAELERTVRRTLAAEALEQAFHAYDRGRAGSEDVPGLVRFGRETFPGAELLPQWRALQRRQRVGARWAHYVPPFVASAVGRRFRNEFRYARWARTGI
jgi:hypothetical protein